MAYKDPPFWALLKDLKRLVEARDKINRQIDETKLKLERECAAKAHERGK